MTDATKQDRMVSEADCIAAAATGHTSRDPGIRGTTAGVAPDSDRTCPLFYPAHVGVTDHQRKCRTRGAYRSRNPLRPACPGRSDPLYAHIRRTRRYACPYQSCADWERGRRSYHRRTLESGNLAGALSGRTSQPWRDTQGDGHDLGNIGVEPIMDRMHPNGTSTQMVPDERPCRFGAIAP